MPKLSDSFGSIVTLEDMASRGSKLHAIGPLPKIITTLVYIAAVISFDRYHLSALMVYFLYPVMAAAVAELPYQLLFKRLMVALPFSFFAGVSNLFFDMQIAANVFGIAISFGFIAFLTVMVKTVLTVMAVLILVATTPIDAIFDQLVKRKVPKVLVMILMLTYRYISVITQEASGMYTAYILRSSDVRGVKMRDMGAFAGQLFIKSHDRAERVYAAMWLRGFDGEYHFESNEEEKLSGFLYALVVSGLFILFRFVNVSEVIGAYIR